MERLVIRFDTNKKIPLYIQIYEGLVNEMKEGHIAQGEKLPSVRALAKQLNLSKSTIENAYDKLLSEGYLTSRLKSGYYCDIPSFKQQTLQKPPLKSNPPKEIRYDFSSRFIEPGHFESKLWRRYMRYTLEDESYIASYGTSQGEYELREALAHFLYRERAVETSAEQLVIGAGIQPLLYLFCSLFRHQKLKVGFLKPSFQQARTVFEDCQHEIVLLNDLNDIKTATIDVLYLSYVHTPKKMKERIQLLKMITSLDIMLIEDDYQGEMHYISVGANSLQGLASDAKIFYLNSFSKQLLPSVRMACMSFPSVFNEALAYRLSAYHQTASKLEQHVFSSYIQDGHLERCIKRQRKVYLKRSQKLEATLLRYFEKSEIELLENQLCFKIKRRFDESFYKSLAEKKIEISQRDDGYLYLYFSGVSDAKIESAISEMFEN